MDKLIALVDASLYGESVCDHAIWVAQRTGAAVELLHMLGRPKGHAEHADLSGSIGMGARTQLLEELAEVDARRAALAQQQGRAILEDAEARVRAAGVTAVSSRLRHDEIVDTTLAFEQDAGLVVMGKRGEGANFDKGHLGANLERVLRASKRPVLVASRAFKPINRVLVAYDGGPSVERAIAYLASEPGLHEVDLRLLSVGNPANVDAGKLDAAVATLRAAGFSADAERVPGEPEQVIPAQVADAGVDLLVMGAFGHSRIRQLIIGSTTTQMIQRCAVPVLLAR